jgi:hypothetical protein
MTCLMWEHCLWGADSMVAMQLCAVMEKQANGAAFLCEVCSQPLAPVHSKITMTEIEQDTVFVNPSGITHDLTCVSGIYSRAVVCWGVPSSEFSWFPQYAWTVMSCSKCGHHLGWHFTKAGQQSGGLEQFWGLSSKSVNVQSIRMPAEDAFRERLKRMQSAECLSETLEGDGGDLVLSDLSSVL